MNDIGQLQDYVGVMSRPYSMTRSRLGTTTKLFDSKFLCNEQGLFDINEALKEKFIQLKPTYGGFQYLISFSDNTHYEHSDILTLNQAVKNCSKTTDRIVLKWIVKHTIEDFDNELTVIVRVTNPINPLVL